MSEIKDFSLFDLQDTRLDEEWVRQVKLYFDHGMLLVDARSKWERTKADREVTEAEIDQEIRRNPASFGLEKLTEDAIKKTILLQSDYQKKVNRVLDAKHEMDIAQVYIDTLDQRKKALECSVQLQVCNYYSEPKAPKDTGEFINKMKADHIFRRRNSYE